MGLRETLHKLLKFLLAGGSVLLLTLALTYILTEIFNLYYLVSYIIVLACTAIIHFILATTFIFKTRKKHGKRFVFYLIGYLVFYISDVLITRLFTEIVGFHYMGSILFAKGIIFLCKFILYDRILFRDSSFLFVKKND